jgi:hypothetical protein
LKDGLTYLVGQVDGLGNRKLQANAW